MAASTTELLYSSLAADPDLGDLVQMFVDEMPDRIGGFEARLEVGDWHALQRSAHQLKGAAGSYGFDHLTPCAARLEQVLRDQRPEEEVRIAAETLIDLCRLVRAGVSGA